MYGAIDLNELIMSGDVNLVKEFFGDSSWRILPEDALPEDKFVAEMRFGRFDTEMFPGSTVAHGHIFNDSRGIFLDGDRVRTSAIKATYVIDGQPYIETRNTVYKVINKEALV